jgi:hypothetical protein
MQLQVSTAASCLLAFRWVVGSLLSNCICLCSNVYSLLALPSGSSISFTRLTWHAGARCTDAALLLSQRNELSTRLN